MIIVLTGGTGLVGKALGQKLVEQGHALHVLTRSPKKKLNYSCKTFLWEASEKPSQDFFPQSKQKWGVIHLAGESISHWPWTSKRKKRIYTSRILGTKNLVQALKELPHPPHFFVSASAVGIYGDQNGNICKESSQLSSTSSLFLEKVCKDWEKEVLNSETFSKVIILRFGMILSALGGALPSSLNSTKKRMHLWSLNKIWINWIHVQDVIKVIIWTLNQPSCQGIYNVTSPEPVTLNSFSKELLRSLKKKYFVLFPVFILKILGGEMARNLLANVKVVPERLNKEGYTFLYPSLKEALKNIVKPTL